MAELGTGWISVTVDGSKITPGIKKALGEAEPTYSKAGDSGGKSFGAKFSSTAGAALKKGGLAAGAAGGAAVAAGLTKGIGRLNSIEQAEAKLKGLGNSTAQVGSIMENALASVKGTSFGLEEAATSAAGLVAAGIKPGQELEQILTTVGDTATIAGTSMADMGTIFGSVAARGKLQGDDMLQLLSRGVPVLQLLADETGKTSGEISDMVSKGEIDFQTFANAMKRGMGGAALEAGNTVQGAMKNMGAAAGRLGATIAGPFFTQAAGGFTGVTDALDKMNDRAKPVMDEFASWMTNKGVPAVKDFASNAVSSLREVMASDTAVSVFAHTRQAVEQLIAAGKSLAPVAAQMGAALSKATAALGVSAWDVFVGVLRTAGAVAEALAGPLQTVADIMSDHPAMVAAAVAAWTGFKTVPALMSKVAGGIAGMTGAAKSLNGVEKPAERMAVALAPITARAKSASAGMTAFGTSMKVQKGIAADMGVKLSTVDAAMGAMGGTSSKTAQAMSASYVKASASLKSFAMQQQLAANAAQEFAMSGKGIMNTADGIARSMGHSAVASVSSFAGTVKGLGASAMTGFKAAGAGVIDMLGGPWGAAMAAGAAGVALYSAGQQRLNSIMEAGETIAGLSKNTYREMFEVFSSGGDAAAAMTSQVKALTDAMKQQADATDSVMDKLEVTAGSFDTTSAAGTNLGVVFAKAWTTIKGNGEAEDAKKAIDNLGMSEQQLAEVINGSQAGYDAMRQKLVDMGDGGEAAAQRLDTLRDAQVRAKAASDELGPAASAAKNAIKEIGSSSDDAATKVSKFMKAMDELNGVQRSQGEAQAELTNAVQGVSEALSGATGDAEAFAGAQRLASGAIDQTTPAGVAMADSFYGVADAMRESAAAGTPAAQVFSQGSESLYAIGEAAGWSREDIEQLMHQMNLFPDELNVQVKTNGETARMDLVAIGEQVQNLQGSGPYDVKIGVNDEETKQKLEAAHWDIQNYDAETGTADLKIEDQAAQDKFNWWVQNGFPEIDMANPTAVANLDDSGLQVTAEYARLQLATLNMERPTPLADMDISTLDAKNIQALQSVGLLDGQTPTPDAFMNIDQLRSDQQMALALTFDLGAEKPTPVATLKKGDLDQGTADGKSKVQDLDKQKAEPKAKLDPRPVQDGARQAQSAIDGIHGKEVTVSFRAEYTGDWDKASNSGKWTGGLWTGPAYKDGGHHGGYRLPKTGPGTDERDGFLAFDKNNVPAARLDAGEWIINRQNSEKYNRELAQINAGTFPKLPGYADGGRAGVRHANDIIEFAKGIEGKPYVWGGVNWGDCSGGMSAISRYAVGLDPFGGRFATGNEADALQQLGFQLGRGSRGDLRIGWFNGGPWGGHTAGTLPNETNVEMGGARGNGQFGGGAAGAWDPQFTDHAFLPVPTKWVSDLEGMPDTNGFTVGGSGDRSTAGNTVPTGSTAKTVEKTPTSWSEVAGIAGEAGAKGLMGDLLNVLGIPDTPPALQAWQQFQDANARDAQDVEKNTTAGTINVDAPEVNIPDSINRTVEIAYDPSRGAEQWRSTVEMALKRVGGSLGDTDRTVQQIDIESGGDPNITNDWDSNAANGDPSVGLLQVIRSTFEANRDPDLPNDQKHPLANIVAALNYVNGRYGGPANIWPTRAGYANGGQVSGPGGRKADRIPAWLSDMEHVVNATDAIANRDLIGAINAGFPAQQVMSGLLDANRELSVAAAGGDGGFGSLTALLGEDHARLVAEMAADVGAVSSSGGGQQMVVNNQFIAANPEEMHRQYRREAAKYSRGKVGAR